MGIAVLSSENVEKKVLSLLMTSPTYVRAMSVDINLFALRKHRRLAKLLGEYVSKYKSPPTVDSLKEFFSTRAKENTLEDYAEALETVKGLPKVDPKEANFYFSQAEEYRVGRLLYDISDKIKGEFESGSREYKKFRKEILTELLTSAPSDGTVNRGFLNEKHRVEDRWKRYREISTGDVISDLVPYGINSLDEFFGGMAKTFVTLLYSKTGGGKTRTAVNIAYNCSRLGLNVVYFTLEMAFNLLGSLFDSREALLDSHDIIFGKLSKEDKKKYKNLLRKKANRTSDVWLVDIPNNATTINILEELDIYKSIHGISPDLVVVDYAHLVEPMRRYKAGDRSAKFDHLFSEFHEIARTYNCSLLTAAQESREASKADAAKKKKDDDSEEDGVHKIGLSNYMAPHCETVIRLKQDKFDRVRDRLWAISDKNRYGKTAEKIPLTALWALTYVGDKLTDAGIKIKKGN